MYWSTIFILLTPSIAECHVRRNLEYIEKNGVPVNLITPAMFQADAVDEEFDMPFLGPPIMANEDVPMECLVFSNASDFDSSEGIVVDCEHIGWLDEGDWLAYTIPLNSSAFTIYNLTLSVTSPLGDGSFRVENYDTQEIYATVDNFPLTEDWNSYNYVTASLDMANSTDATNVTILIRSMEPGWTFRDLCLQGTVPPTPTEPTPTEPTPTEPVPTEPTPPVTAPASMPSAKPTLFVASETVSPTQATTAAPTKVVTPLPQEMMTLTPTAAVVSEAPSDVLSSRPTIALETISSVLPTSVPTIALEEATTVPPTSTPSIAFETSSTVLPTSMPSTVIPTMLHTTLEPSLTYSPSMSDYPSVSYEGIPEHKKSSKKSKRSGKGSSGKGSSGKGSSKSGKGSAGLGKGSSGKGNSSSGKGSSGKGNNSSGKGYAGSGLGGSGKGYTGSGNGSSGKSSTGSGKGGIETGSGSGKGYRF